MNPDLAALTGAAASASDTIVRFGLPGVALVLLLVVALPVKVFLGASPDWNRLALAAALPGLLFLIADGAILLATLVRPGLFSSGPSILAGQLSNVPSGFQAQIASDLNDAATAYAKTIYDPDHAETKDYQFLFLTRNVPACLNVAISNASKMSEDGDLFFRVKPIGADDMGGASSLRLTLASDAGSPKLTLERYRDDLRVGEATAFDPLQTGTEPLCEAKPATTEWFGIQTAFADVQLPLTDEQIEARLRSDDAFIRRDARIALANKGLAALALLRKLIFDDADYRLQIGAVVAIAGMPLADRQKLPADILQKLRMLETSSDRAMSQNARAALNGLPP